MNFQEMILALNSFWGSQGCIIQQPYDIEKGAGTMNPATFLRALGAGAVACGVCRAQSADRPTVVYGDKPNRLQHYYQYQVILKPSPDNIQEMYLDSLQRYRALIPEEHDIRFVEDNWESPTLGAWGLGLGGLAGRDGSQHSLLISSSAAVSTADPVCGEITYGMERLATFIQQKLTAFMILCG